MEQITKFIADLQAKLLSRVPPFAEDAFIFILPLGLLACILFIIGVFGTLMGFLTCLLLIVLIICFFRDPERVIPEEPDVLVSPADGVVNEIVEDEDPFTGEKCQRITIFLSIFDPRSAPRRPMAT